MSAHGLAQFIATHPEVGWVVLLALAFEQLFAPWETRTERLLKEVLRDAIREETAELRQTMKAQAIISRALARALDNPEKDVKVDDIDEVLVENGISPDDFLTDGGETHGAD